jgi:hypothetical protein
LGFEGMGIARVLRRMTGRFVILEHRWRGVHWDLMLETAGGCLRTWAIDEEIVGGRVVGARRLGDHRVEYLGYEGPISGDRGWVRRVDEGVYESELWEAGRVEVRLCGRVHLGRARLWAVAGDDWLMAWSSDVC